MDELFDWDRKSFQCPFATDNTTARAAEQGYGCYWSFSMENLVYIYWHFSLNLSDLVQNQLKSIAFILLAHLWQQ